MKKLYIIGASIVFLLILVLSLPQIAAKCIWYDPVPHTLLPTIVLFQAAGLGGVLGGLLVLLWKSRNEGEAGDGDEGEK
jgi:hypothetical protein